MHRFYIDPRQSQDPVITLSEREAHHAVNVLRVRSGESAVALDGNGVEILGELTETSRKGLQIKVRQKHNIPPLPYQLTLIQAIPRGKAMDTIVQKATELGAHRIVPLVSDRTVAHVEEESAAHKIEKWQATAIESIKQCGSAWLPKIDAPSTPSAFLAAGERFDLSFLATLQADARHPRVHFGQYQEEKKRRPASVAVWIGPEGDFTPAEINSIRSWGALPITLGQLVLRSDTAAIYALSVINYELQSPAGNGD